MLSNFKNINILIVDDHAVMREGIGALIKTQPDMLIVGEAENGVEAVHLFKNLQPDVTIQDINLPLINGIAAINLIRAEFPQARFIVITALTGDSCLRKALVPGVQAILLKDMLRKELLPAIRAVHSGRQYFPTTIARHLGFHG